MASRRNYFPSQIHPSTSTSTSTSTDHLFEFQESDIWTSEHNDLRSPISPPDPRHSIPNFRSWKRKTTSLPSNPAPSSLPVNIPDWSKILGSRGGGGHWSEDHDTEVDGGGDEDDDDEDEEDRVPPHEHAARQVARRSGIMVTFSVHEGVGRTLKGRDLRRVRNAIWKQTGFED